MELAHPIHILLMEDSEDDALLLDQYLRDQGLVFTSIRVEDLEGLRAALIQGKWDVLLSDFHLPTTNGFEVLQEVRRLAPNLPSIIISGWIDEAAAVDAMRAGAKDFVAKSRLARLAPAILREVGEAREHARSRVLREELDDAESRLGAIVGNALDGIVMLDPTGRISFWNPSAERIFGYTKAEALGQDLQQMIAPDRHRELFLDVFGRFRATGEDKALGKVLELSGLRKGGEEFPIEFTLAPLWSGNSWYAVGILRDISERKRLELEQLESLQFLKTLVETIPSPVYHQGPEGYILGCNRAMKTFFGLPEAGLVGRRMTELLDEEVSELSASLDQLLMEKTGTREFSAKAKSESLGLRDVVFRRDSYRHADGRVAGIVGTIQDVTDLKRAEETLRQTEALFTTIHSHIVDLVAIIDSSGKRLYTSPSYLFVLGYTSEDMSGFGSNDLLHPEDRGRVERALRALARGRPTLNLEYRLRHKDGRYLEFESTATPIVGTGDQGIQALIVARNVTERREAEQRRNAMEVQLRQAQKLEAIGQLAAGIAHEINTPTQYIGDNAAFLRDSFEEAFSLMGRLMAHLDSIRVMEGPAGEAATLALADLAKTDLEYLGEEIPKAIQQSLEGVGRITKIVSAMKDFSHPGGESKSLVDLHRAIESTITVSRNEWKYTATLETDFDPSLSLVPCFPSEFNQVVLNLIVNAAHAIEAAKGGRDSGQLGRIVVKTRRLEQEVEVSVADDGAGIPLEIQNRIFEPFFTTKPVGKGSGQGLAIAHAVVVEKHKGRLEVESAPGQGTTFRIYLPLEQPAP